jgi:hypothetical protein
MWHTFPQEYGCVGGCVGEVAVEVWKLGLSWAVKVEGEAL